MYNQPPQNNFNQPPQSNNFNQPPQNNNLNQQQPVNPMSGMGNTPNQQFNQPPQNMQYQQQPQQFNQPPQNYQQQQQFNQYPQQQQNYPQQFNQPQQNMQYQNQQQYQQQPYYNQQQQQFNQPKQQQQFNQPPVQKVKQPKQPGQVPQQQFNQVSAQIHIQQPQYRGDPSCKKCRGTGWKAEKNKPCRKCNQKFGIVINKGQIYQAPGKFNQIPQQQMYRGDPSCKKCHGTGWKAEKNKPCKKCNQKFGIVINKGGFNQPPGNFNQVYQQQQYRGDPNCKKCFGTGWKAEKNKPCKKCNLKYR